MTVAGRAEILERADILEFISGLDAFSRYGLDRKGRERLRSLCRGAVDRANCQHQQVGAWLPDTHIQSRVHKKNHVPADRSGTIRNPGHKTLGRSHNAYATPANQLCDVLEAR